ncbi:MAG: hypothetical protein AB2L07_21640 [Thermoanaerobaculaceae bacterium]
MSGVLFVAGGCALLLLVAQRLVWLAPTRLGWVFYLANVVGEVVPKRLGLGRGPAEVLISLVGFALLLLGGATLPAIAYGALALAAIEAMLRLHERRLLTAAWTRIDTIGAMPSDSKATQGLAAGFPFPSAHPDLTVTLEGPFVVRYPRLSLGSLVVGRRFQINVVVANHTLVATQTGTRVRLRLPQAIVAPREVEVLLPVITPGEVRRVGFELVAASSSGAGQIGVQVAWGPLRDQAAMGFDGIADGDGSIAACVIRRYPGGRRSAFAWRGDMDLYDRATLQTIEGLEVSLGLGARYRTPQTLYLSTRLSLDVSEAQQWSAHFGVDRGAEEIPRFVQWLRSNVDIQHRAEYPFDSDRPFLIELGNHGHLHFGDNSSAADGNGWRLAARMGAGRYPWLALDTSSYAEQRDNALEARRWIERLLGFTPKSWAMPDRTRDEHTPAAMEAAGCEVLSDSDVRTRDNVLVQPPPHFAGDTGAVELTKRYPGDPQHILHYWMNLFWVHRAHRLGIPMVFMCHQHLRLFEGWACSRLTEAILRYVLHRFSGDLWISTVYGIGVYWRDVLSERRTVKTELHDGVVTIRNHGNLTHCDVPVDLTLAGGGRATVLVDLEPGVEVRLDARGIQ